MKTLCKDEFLDADDLPLVPMPLPEDLYGKDCGFYVRTTTATQRSLLEKRFLDEDVRKHPGKFRSIVLMLCVVDENGAPIFEDADRPRLMEKNSGTVELLFAKACELNGLTKKDVEELEKN